MPGYESWIIPCLIGSLLCHKNWVKELPLLPWKAAAFYFSGLGLQRLIDRSHFSTVCFIASCCKFCIVWYVTRWCYWRSLALPFQHRFGLLRIALSVIERRHCLFNPELPGAQRSSGNTMAITIGRWGSAADAGISMGKGTLVLFSCVMLQALQWGYLSLHWLLVSTGRRSPMLG